MSRLEGTGAMRLGYWRHILVGALVLVAILNHVLGDTDGAVFWALMAIVLAIVAGWRRGNG